MPFLLGFLFGRLCPRTALVLLVLLCWFGFYFFTGGAYWLIREGFGSFLLHALPGSRLFLG